MRERCTNPRVHHWHNWRRRNPENDPPWQWETVTCLGRVAEYRPKSRRPR